MIHRLAQLAPRLQPEQLHRVIDAYGLEDCGELVAHATPAQLSRIFDLDLWKPARPGLDEQFDAERFGTWIEVLVNAGSDLAAEKLSQMQLEQLIPGFSHYARVFDIAAIAAYDTTDGERVESRAPDTALTCEIGGYCLVAQREDAWQAIVAVLLSLDAHHRGRFDELMGALRSLSSVGRELDGLDTLLEAGDQAMFEAGTDRELRRNKQGFASPADARAFLQTSRNVRPGVVPSANPVASAYFRSIATSRALSQMEPNTSDTDADVMELLTEAGIVTRQEPRGLLTGDRESSRTLPELTRYMRLVFHRNLGAFEERQAELAYLANALMAGCSIQSRPFTPKEASDAAAAACNLGLANPDLPDDYLVGHDLVGIFQIGWTALHEEVAMYAARTLIDVVGRMQCYDEQVQSELDTLRTEMSRQVHAGTPWKAAPSLDAIATLDQPAWVAMVALIAECPVIHDALTASLRRRPEAIDPQGFTFISGKADIARVREFMAALPGRLSEK